MASELQLVGAGLAAIGTGAAAIASASFSAISSMARCAIRRPPPASSPTPSSARPLPKVSASSRS